MEVKKILVPVDFSKHSREALDYAVNFAAPFGAEVVALHVVEPVAYSTPADLYAGMATQLGDLLTEQRRAARAQLDELADEYARRGFKIRTQMRDGIAYREVVDGAKKLKADMIVQATHGRTGLSHILLGSVAERIVRTADCPVLTIRTSGKTARKKAAKKKAAKKTATKKKVTKKKRA